MKKKNLNKIYELSGIKAKEIVEKKLLIKMCDETDSLYAFYGMRSYEDSLYQNYISNLKECFAYAFGNEVWRYSTFTVTEPNFNNEKQVYFDYKGLCEELSKVFKCDVVFLQCDDEKKDMNLKETLWHSPLIVCYNLSETALLDILLCYGDKANVIFIQKNN